MTPQHRQACAAGTGAEEQSGCDEVISRGPGLVRIRLGKVILGRCLCQRWGRVGEHIITKQVFSSSFSTNAAGEKE